MKYLYRQTTKHRARYHLIAADGLHLLSKRCSQVEVGKRGWKIVEREPAEIWRELCWHCEREAKR